MIKDYFMYYLKRLSGARLDAFCTYWNSGPVPDGLRRAKAPRIGDDADYRKGYYRRYDLSDGWSLYDHRYDGLVQLCDGEEIVRLKGSSRQIMGLLLNLVRTEDALRAVPQRDYGLVLSGGGAKGAFEIGVWRWLEKAGLMEKITGISGTSVGALNSVLFSCVSLEEAEEIWRSIRQEDLLHFDLETLQRIAESLARTMIAAQIRGMSPALVLKDLLPLAGAAVFTQDKLSEIADRVLKRRFKADRVVFSCLARQSLQDQAEPPAQGVLASFHNADYYCLNGRRDTEIRKIILASAAIPGIYDPVEINRFAYRDGGCRDNTPYTPLVEAGFQKIIVVHLTGKRAEDPAIEMVRNSVLFHVYPTQKADSVAQTLRISEETTENWISNGEQAAGAQLGRFLRKGELVLPDHAEDYTGKERNVEKFDFEHFDYEEAFSTIQSEVKKPNILICGATGVGKSTMIRDLFQMSDLEGPEIGNLGRSKTTGIHVYSPEGATVALYDSQGYNIGSDEKQYMKDVLGVIDKKRSESPEDMAGHIHEVWYCVSAANNRFFEADEKMLREIRRKYKIPAMVVLTKVDCVDEEAIASMKEAVREKIPEIEIFSYASDERTQGWDEDLKRRFVQADGIMNWALLNLDESLRAGLIPAMKKALAVKRKYIAGKVIPRYAGFAAAAVIATSFVNVPFTDSVPLMALQVTMAAEIIQKYGIRAEVKQLAANLVGTSAVSVIGRTLAGNIIKVIPLAGNLLNATVNTSVAASVTAALGFAITLVCEQYLAMCIDNNGAENLPFVQFLTPERLAEAMKYVNGHSGEFDMQSIVKEAVAAAASQDGKDSRNE